MSSLVAISADEMKLGEDDRRHSLDKRSVVQEINQRWMGGSLEPVV